MEHSPWSTDVPESASFQKAAYMGTNTCSGDSGDGAKRADPSKRGSLEDLYVGTAPWVDLLEELKAREQANPAAETLPRQPPLLPADDSHHLPTSDQNAGANIADKPTDGSDTGSCKGYESTDSDTSFSGYVKSARKDAPTIDVPGESPLVLSRAEDKSSCDSGKEPCDDFSGSADQNHARLEPVHATAARDRAAPSAATGATLSVDKPRVATSGSSVGNDADRSNSTSSVGLADNSAALFSEDSDDSHANQDEATPSGMAHARVVVETTSPGSDDEFSEWTEASANGSENTISCAGDDVAAPAGKMPADIVDSNALASDEEFGNFIAPQSASTSSIGHASVPAKSLTLESFAPLVPRKTIGSSSSLASQERRAKLTDADVSSLLD